jgi:pullulanase
VTTTEILPAPPAATLSRPRWLVVHYRREDSGYGGWALHAWGDIAADQITGFPGGHPFAGEDSYGRFAWVRLADDARDVGFLVVDGSGGKDVAEDRHVDPGASAEVWLRAGDPLIYDSPAAAGGPAAAAPDPGVAVIHYRRADGDYSGWGLHAWEGTPAKPVWRLPLTPAGYDAFGAVFRVPVRSDAVGVRFVVHRGDVKDLPDDQRLDLTVTREVWLLSGNAAPVRPDLRSLGPELDPARALAVFVDRTTIALPAHLADLAAGFALVAAAGGALRRAGDELAGEHTTLPLTFRPGGLFQAQSRRFPHLRAYRAFSVRELGDAALGYLLRGQLLVVGHDTAGRVAVITGVQLPGVLDDLYAEAADADLGVLMAEERPTLAVWAPTARTVQLELSRAPGEEPKLLPMDRDGVTGVWSIAGKRKWLGRYYRYRVEVWHPAAQRIVTTSVTDPYSLSLAVDSTHSQMVDLADPALCPPGWATLAKPPAVAPARMQISELHVRDFSIADETVPAADRGTYLAFTHPESAGMRHLRSLADAGLTHLHLLPAFDYATVPDRRADQRQPRCDLAALPPDSPEQQREVMAVADDDGFNWGYDPLHYTAPEGSFAVEPSGAARILEFRRMVAALADAGLRVVMDVVYNHTMADGLATWSVLDKIVPGYYHRLLEDGTTAESTCCPNTAPEHTMMGRLVVDSIVTWARQYKVDGFRFDLMGHHPRANILEAKVSLDHLTADVEGVDGHEVYLYGEGWNFGEVAYDARFAQATQVNMAGTGIGTFNDRLRDAVRGGGSFGDDPSVQGFASGLGSSTPLALHDRIKVGRPGDVPFPDPHRRRAERRTDRLQRLPERLRGRARRDGQLRRRPRQRDPVRRDGLQTAGRDADPGPGPAAGPGAVPGRARPGRRLRGVRHGTPALQVPGPQLVQLRRLVQPDPLGRRRGKRLRRRPATGGGERGQVALGAPAARGPGAGAGGRGDRVQRGALPRVAAHPALVSRLRAAYGRRSAAPPDVPLGWPVGDSGRDCDVLGRHGLGPAVEHGRGGVQRDAVGGGAGRAGAGGRCAAAAS